MLRQADVYLFDEPNSALTEQESQALFATMEQLAADGKIVLLITHRLNDFVRCCRRVMVLRDGRITGDLSSEAVTEQAIAAELSTQAARADGAASSRRERARGCHGAPLLNLDGCKDHAGAFSDISLKLMPGRVVALAGVEGSGARELAQAIGRYRELSRGEQRASTDRMASVAYLAASRRDTVFRNLTVGENLVARLGRHSLCGRSGFLSLRQIEELGRRSVQQYRVKTGSLSSPITSLSGGNQQKVVLGAAMEQGCDIIVIEEPTRGVDISSKADIYALLRSYAAEGRSVVMFCTEVQEIFDAADEVVVLSRGRIVGQVNLSEIEDIPALADLMALYENFQDEVQPAGAQPRNGLN
ncbi:ATP-binding cassette domain-containing protein [Mesorhizobium sp. BAC0120]|uniref:ATP-binding cassette domain-containing protein n=1 Tax=Mesorhizobium sp. BAC0120 TaxID=3090670 RepID=UPI00298C71F8|nr:ATP-binding cassette domain-containing protein [Mesorhizobium sp. BAC0120]MDW6023519.1 ATP-binding cassette domain-containing protein [Mesorhizobium sp. BAC0120]